MSTMIKPGDMDPNKVYLATVNGVDDVPVQASAANKLIAYSLTLINGLMMHERKSLTNIREAKVVPADTVTDGVKVTLVGDDYYYTPVGTVARDDEHGTTVIKIVGNYWICENGVAYPSPGTRGRRLVHLGGCKFEIDGAHKIYGPNVILHDDYFDLYYQTTNDGTYNISGDAGDIGGPASNDFGVKRRALRPVTVLREGEVISRMDEPKKLGSIICATLKDGDPTEWTTLIRADIDDEDCPWYSIEYKCWYSWDDLVMVKAHEEE